MSKKYDNSNRGQIWKNPKWSPGDNATPKYSGHGNFDGKDFWISAWAGDSDNKKAPVLTFSYRLKEDEL